MGGYLVQRKNLTIGGEISYIGKGKENEPFSTYKNAQAAAKRQEKEDFENCPDFCITYTIVDIDKKPASLQY